MEQGHGRQETDDENNNWDLFVTAKDVDEALDQWRTYYVLEDEAAELVDGRVLKVPARAAVASVHSCDAMPDLAAASVPKP